MPWEVGFRVKTERFFTYAECTENTPLEEIVVQKLVPYYPLSMFELGLKCFFL